MMDASPRAFPGGSWSITTIVNGASQLNFGHHNQYA